MTQDSIEIIKELREARFGWIADELVESLSLGRQTSKEFQEPESKKKSKATAIEPFTADEEMELIVETLAQYFIVTPSAWKAARGHFLDSGTFAKVHLKEEPNLYEQIPVAGETFIAKLGISGEGEEPFFDFDEQYTNDALPALRRVLAALWPRGVNDFQRRFSETAGLPK